MFTTLEQTVFQSNFYIFFNNMWVPVSLHLPSLVIPWLMIEWVSEWLILKSRFHEFSYSMLTLNIKVTEDNFSLELQTHITAPCLCPAGDLTQGSSLAGKHSISCATFYPAFLIIATLSKDETVFCYGFGLHFPNSECSCRNIFSILVFSIQYLYIFFGKVHILCLVFKLGYHYY